MIVVLSPSKTLDLETQPRTAIHTQPETLKESEALIKILRGYSPARLSKLMAISDKLAQLNAQRYADFALPFTAKNARQAILTFKGDVYVGIDVEHYTKEDFAFAQSHIRILSGLYGVLRPLDLMQPYRLEMGVRLPNARGKDLYAFWGDRVTDMLNGALAQDKSKLLINLASQEYFRAVRPEKLQGGILSIVFKERKQGKLSIVGLFAKQARGVMADYIVKNRLRNAKHLKNFNENGYSFVPSLSKDDEFIFVR